METFIIVSVVALWIGLIVQTVFLFLMARMTGNFLNRFRLSARKVEEKRLIPGQKAPLFREEDQRGEVVKLAENQGKLSLLLFVKGTCSSCHEILENLPQLYRYLPSMRILVLSRTTLDIPRDIFPNGVHLLQSSEAHDNYFIDKVPTACLVDPQGQVMLSEGLNGFQELELIMEGIFRKAG